MRAVLSETTAGSAGSASVVVGRCDDVPIADHARVIETNLVSHMNDAHAVLPIFLAQDRGTWVHSARRSAATIEGLAVSTSAL